MEFNFIVRGDILAACGILGAVTGNANSYTCRFDLPCDSADYLWVCVFRQGDKAYQQIISDSVCTIPCEVLSEKETVYIGCYATKNTGDFARISTNLIALPLAEGAYCEANVPEIPTPDVWEELVMLRLPYIGENGNWFVYYPDESAYCDSGVLAAGITPQKGVDYWTEQEIEETKNSIKNELTDGLYFTVGENGIVTVRKED